MDILLSIEPRFAEAIFLGTKKWEFRTRKFKIRPRKIYLYSTAPIKGVVGFFESGKILTGTPSEIWSCCGQRSGISKAEFFKRFKSKKLYAIEIIKPKKLRRTIAPTYFRVKRPPQSFRYLEVKSWQSWKILVVSNLVRVFEGFGRDGNGHKL